MIVTICRGEDLGRDCRNIRLYLTIKKQAGAIAVPDLVSDIALP